MKHLILLLTLCASPALKAQVSLADFAGEWTGEGTLFGREATFEMRWEVVLDQKFVALSFSNQVTGSPNVFKASALYSISDTVATWFDNRGYVLPISYELSGNKLIANWGSPDLETGQTIYQKISDTEIYTEDFVRKDGTLSKFGEATYRKTTKRP